MKVLNDKIEQLETLHRNQRANAEHYFWSENNEERGHFWQDRAKETKQDILDLQKEKAIIEKWQKAEQEAVAKASEKSNAVLRAEVIALGEDIQADIHHGECFYEADMLGTFCKNLDHLKHAALSYHASNRTETLA